MKSVKWWVLAFLFFAVPSEASTFGGGSSFRGREIKVSTDCSSTIQEGVACWDSDDDTFCVGTGAACTSVGANSDFAQDFNAETFADDQVFVADNASGGTPRTITNCTDSGGNHLNYTQATNSFSCGTSSSGAGGWSDGGTDITLSTSTDNVGIGGASLGKLSVDGDTDETQLLIQGNGTQTSNLVVFETSAGTDLFTVANDGTITSTGSGTEAATFGGGSQATYVTTYNVSGTDTTATAGSALMTFSHDVTVSGTTSTPTLTLTGTGTINGLDAIDATTEATIEAQVFDADAKTISGVWEVQDDTNFDFGNDADWHIEYDEGVDNQLLFTTTNTSAVATTDPMFEILVGTTPTADQEVFGVAKGSQASNTALFTVDEDGDLKVTGNVTITGAGSQSTITEGLVVNNGNGTDEDDDFTVKANGGTYEVDAGDGTFRSTTNDAGWTVVDQTDNQACTTGCTSACLFGIANATGTAVTNIVSCSDTTADLCLCMGTS